MIDVKLIKVEEYDKSNSDMLEIIYEIDNEIIKIYDAKCLFDNRVHHIRLNESVYDKEHIKRMLKDKVSLFEIVSM